MRISDWSSDVCSSDLIARRLTESKQTVPHFYLTMDCNLDALFRLRAELNAGLEKTGVKLSVNDLLIKALAVALVEVPDARSEEHTSELQSLMRNSYAVFCMKKTNSN